jgi:uncharacterized membrane protein YvlD (DUF360 family)
MLGRLLVMTGVFWGLSTTMPGVNVDGGFKTYFIFALVYTAINAILEIQHIFLANLVMIFPISLHIPLLILIGGVVNFGILLLVSHFIVAYSFVGLAPAFLMGIVIGVVRFFISPSAI